MLEDSQTIKCVRCRQSVRLSRLTPDGSVQCSCLANNSVLAFPAFVERVATISLTADGLDGGTASCYVHGDRAAVAVCSSCGRYACALCSVDEGEKSLCLDCFAASEGSESKNKRYTPWDSVALGMAIIPILIFYFTLLTAPAAIGISIFHWKDKGNEWRQPAKWKFVVAIILSLLQIAGWAALFIGMSLE